MTGIIRTFVFSVFFLVSGYGSALAHEVEPGEMSKESHILLHVMENIYILGYIFAAFVVYLIVKDILKNKGGDGSEANGDAK